MINKIRCSFLGVVKDFDVKGRLQYNTIQYNTNIFYAK